MIFLSVVLAFLNLQTEVSTDTTSAVNSGNKTWYCTQMGDIDLQVFHSCSSEALSIYFVTNLVEFPEVGMLVFPVSDSSSTVTLWEGNYVEFIEKEVTPISIYKSELLEKIDNSFHHLIAFPDSEVIDKDSADISIEDDLIEELNDEIEADSISFNNLRFRFETNITYPEKRRAYEIVIDSTFFVFDLEYPAQLLEDLYIDEVLQRMAKKKDSADFKAALIILEEGYYDLSSSKFEMAAIEIADEWSELSTMAGEHPDSLIHIVGDSFIAETNPQWFNDFRIGNFEQYLDSLAIGEDTFNELIDGYNRLLDWSGDEDKYLILRSDLQASRALYGGELWVAIDYLEISKEIEPENQERIKKLGAILTGAIQRDYKEHSWKNIYDYGKRLFSLFSQNFELRYKFTEAVQRNRDYDLWVKNLEWLLNNYKREQTLVSRKDLTLLLNEAYQAGMQFENALETNRRLYLHEKDNDILDLFVVNLRARMIMPVYDALTEFINQNKDFTQNLQDRIVFYQNNYLNAIYIVDENERYISTLYVSDGVELNWENQHQNLIRERGFHFDSDSLKAWFVLPSDKQTYIIELNTELNDSERVQLREIRNNPDLPNNWIEFVRNNEIRGAVASTTVITALLETIPFPPDKSWAVNFAEQIMNNSSLSHISIYDGANSTIVNKTTVSDSLSNSREWINSLNRQVLYHQVLLDREVSILDMTNAIIQDNEKKGVFKIGYYQIE